MPSRHRKRPRDRVLIAGDRSDLAAIQHVLALLAEDAYGQVFIEVLDLREVIELDAPPRVSVSWLSRVTRPSAVRPLAFAAHGEALSTAVAGWVGEWMPEDEAGEVTLMWIGCTGSLHVTALYDALQARLQGLNALPDLSQRAQ